MQKILLYVFGVAGALLLARNFHEIFLVLPDEKMQGAIYRILFIHAPAAFTFFTASFVAMVASILFLWKHDFRHDSLAVAATEVGLAFGTVNLITGMIWARNQWGVWWAWDARLTWMLISWLLYSGYLMLRQGIDEPTQRARSSAVLSILAFPGVVITYKAIDWWRGQHPSAVLSARTGGGTMDPDMEAVLYLNWLALLAFGYVLLYVRTRQEQIRRELDAMRRQAHAI